MSQTRVDSSEVSDGGRLRAEVALYVRPCVPWAPTDTRGNGGSHDWGQCARNSSLEACWFNAVWLRRWPIVRGLAVRAALGGRLVADRASAVNIAPAPQAFRAVEMISPLVAEADE